MCYTQALLMDSLILNSVAHILLLLPTTDLKIGIRQELIQELSQLNRCNVA